jgi:DNA-binding SARP family transcriptional activator/WD40 repeat protein
LNVLGPVELCYHETPVEVTGPTRTLLALLARTPCEEVSTASIIAGMWGDTPPEDSEVQVASCVSRLRKALTAVAPNVDPTSVVVTLPTGYILAIQPSNADILAFERLLADAKRAIAVGQPALALRQVDAALALWRGNAYEDFGELAFAKDEAQRLEDLRLSAVESRVDALLALHAPGGPPDLLAHLQDRVAQHWQRQRLWGQLMTVLVRLGRRTEALAVHRRAQEQLAQRLHVQPGAELRAIEEAVIDRDPRLLGVPLRAGTVPQALAVTVPPCHGREQEVAWLCAAMDLAATRRAQARLIVGSPGMGKSRLIAEVAQRAAERGAAIRYWRADARGIETHVVEHDRLSVVIVEDLDQAQHEDVNRVVTFIRSAMTRPVVTFITCRDPVRVGDLATVPKLVLSPLDGPAIAEIVRAYAPSVAEKSAVSAMSSAGGVPAKVHRAASEWAFARAGRRIDRAVADSAEPRRTLAALREEVVAGALELAYVRARARSLRPVVRAPGCPYPGLAGYGPADAELFHGRERLVAQVLARLAEAPLLALVGDPGSGKTSLLRAGVLPAVAAGVLPDSGRWRQIVVTPSSLGGQPWRAGGAVSLADLLTPPPTPAQPAPELTRSNPLTTPTALLPIAVPARGTTTDHASVEADSDGDQVENVPDFARAATPKPSAPPDEEEGRASLGHRDGILPTGAFTALTPTAGLPALRLPTGRTPAVDLVAPGSSPSVRPEPPAARVAEPAADEPAPTLLVVDQLEEAFVLLDDEQRAEFFETLIAATKTGRVMVILRSDFYRHCERYPALAELVTANLLAVTPITEDELRAAIVRPAQLAGLEVEPGLVERLVAEVEDGNGGLAHLSVALRELWHGRSGTTLTLAAYQSGPGLADAVAAHAEAVVARMPTPQARSAARTLLAGMCSLTEDRLAVRARVNLTQLLARAGAGALPALEVLTAGGLVTVSQDIDTVQLSYDVLLTSWPRLRDAVDDVAAETGLRRHLHRAATAWAAGGRPGAALYRGTRLVTALDLSERHGAHMSTVEKDFLTASQRAVLVTEARRRKRMVLLWKWVIGTTLLTLLATAIAVVSVVMQVRTVASAQRSDATRLGVQALAEPDLRRSVLLAVAATRLDPDQASVLRTLLQRTPDLVAMAGTGVSAAAISPDGSTVALGSTSGPILLLDADTLRTSATLEYPGHTPVNGLTFTRDGQRLVSWGGPGASTPEDQPASIVVWDLASQRPTGTAFGQVWPGAGGGLLSDHATLVLAQHGPDPAGAATAVAWNIDAHTPSTAYPLPTSTVDALVVSPDGAQVALATGGDTVVRAMLDDTSRTLRGAALPLAFSPDGRSLLAAAGAQVQIWDVGGPGAPRQRTLATHDQTTAAAWAPDGQSFATAGPDGKALLWSTADLAPLRGFDAGTAPMTAVWFAPDARTLYAVGADGALLAFDLTGDRGIGAEAAGTAETDPALVSLACRLAGRGLSTDEWRTYLPDRPFEQICP